MTTVGYCGDLNGVIELAGGGARVRFDGTSGREQVMEAYREAGFPRPLLWLMGDEPWRWCGVQAEPGSAQFEALYRQVIRSMLDESRRRHWPGMVFQPVDEPGSYGVRPNADQLERWAVQSRLIKEAGGTVEVDHIPFSTDDPRLRGALERALPYIDIFTQRFSTKPIWFEPDGWWWGNMREGVDDLRYLQALERLIAHAEADGRREGTAQARAVLARLADSFDMEELRARNSYLECQWEESPTLPSGAPAVGGSFDVPIGWDLSDYDQWRGRVAGQIMRLGGRG